MEDLKFIVTGTGRCGTVYMAKLLTSLGIPCSHEGVFYYDGLERAKERIKSNQIETSPASMLQNNKPVKKWLDDMPIADSSYMAAPFLGETIAKIIHVVRNPLLVLESFYHEVGLFSDNPPEIQLEYRKFVYRHLPELNDIQKEIDRIAYYIIRWNEMIEQHNVFRHQAELTLNPALAEFIGVKPTANFYQNTRTNTWKKKERPPILLSQISEDLRQNFLDMSLRYGYVTIGERMKSIQEMISTLDEIKAYLQTMGEPNAPVAQPPSKMVELAKSKQWPEAAPQDMICDANQESDKETRATMIVRTYIDPPEGKKFLDFGCGEGHVAKEAAKTAVLSVGYDPNLKPMEDGNLVFTDDFQVVKARAPFDTVLLLDVLDHCSNPIQVLEQVKEVCDANSKIHIRVHPWCSRHGGHAYYKINKAFVHLILNEKELETFGVKLEDGQRVLHPIKTYEGWLRDVGLVVTQKNIERQDVENFFRRPDIMERFKKAGYKDFPGFQLEQSFHDYIVKLA